MRKFLFLIFIAAILIYPQTEEQKKHPKYPEFMKQYSAYVAANKKGDYNTALKAAETALQLGIEIAGENDPLTATLHSNLGAIFSKKAEYDKAIEYNQKSLTIKIKTLGENHPSVAISYNNLGSIYDAKGEYDKAIEYYQKDLAISIKSLDENHPNVATSYNNLGEAYRIKGEYDKAIEYNQKSLTIKIKTLGENHPSVAISYNNLGLSFSNKGEYDKAIEYNQKSLTIRLKSLGENHPSVATSYNNLGLSFSNKGEYDKAIEYYQKSLTIQLQSLGENHPSVSTSYNNLGLSFSNKGEYDKAIEYNQKSITIKIKTLGENHPSVATSYNNLGSIYDNKGEYDKAIEYYQKSITIKIKTLGENHPSVATSYNNLGSIYDDKREYDKAIEYYQKSITIHAKVPGDKFGYISAYENLAYLYEKKKDIPNQIKTLEKAADLILDFRLELGKDKDFFTQENKPIFDKLYKLYIDSNQLEKAFQITEKMRGLSILENSNLKFALHESGVKEEDRKKIIETQENLEGLYSTRAAILRNLSQKNDPTEEKKADSLWKQITKLQEEENSLEKKIAGENPRFRELRKIVVPTLSEFQRKFGEEKKTFIEYRLVKDNAGKDSLSAFVINGSGNKNLKLGENLDLESKVFNLRKIISADPDERSFVTVKRKSGKEYVFANTDECADLKDSESKLNELTQKKTGKKNENQDEFNCTVIRKLDEDTSTALMEELLKELHSILIQPILDSGMVANYTVVISPDAELFTVPYSALKNKEGKYFSEEYQFSLIPSAVIWDKLKRTEKRNYKSEFFGMGNPVYAAKHKDTAAEYNAKNDSAPKEKRGLPDLKKKLSRAVDTKNSFEDIEKNMPNLPGSIGELEIINKIVNETNQLSEEHFYQGIRANKDLLFDKFETKKQNRDYRIAHFSVHGLFFGDAPELNSLALTTRNNALEHRKDTLESYEKQNGELKQDGFLKLGETIDLGLKCELVVMSACETSLGTQKAGEGLVGLPQAFLMGGAKNVMATLWSVDDAGTLKFMKVFYTKVFDLANKDIPIPVLLKQTQKELSDKTNNKYYHDPFYWSAFVVYGR
ncbi:MAG: CHAT domain-containing protein [Leptospiraceae bacterium]|nr:CHAT domain-containing protein [Leptospiraceae bacterium]